MWQNNVRPKSLAKHYNKTSCKERLFAQFRLKFRFRPLKNLVSKPAFYFQSNAAVFSVTDTSMEIRFLGRTIHT